MNKNEVISTLTGEEVLVSGSDIFFYKKSAISFIKKCKQQNRQVLGIELFNIDDRKLIPDINKIADFSNASISKSFEFSVNFVKCEMKEDMVANFTI